MELIYEDFFRKLNEHELNFFTKDLKNKYEEKKKEQSFSSSIAIYNLIYNSNWVVKKNDDTLDIFSHYLVAQGLIHNLFVYADKYDFFVTKLGMGYINYILSKISKESING